MTWFGYKLHLAVDTASELPVAFELTPANINDDILVQPLLLKDSFCCTYRKKAKILCHGCWL
ncbi:MAG: transposase [Syntrophomonadaceae bacterium]